MTFGKPDGSGVTQTGIEHRKNSGNEDFITGATCVSKNKKNYFIFSGTNFGNCKDGCEWMDVFTENGNYAGSTGGRYGDISFKRKSLTKTAQVIVSEIDGLLRSAGSDATIEITR